MTQVHATETVQPHLYRTEVEVIPGEFLMQVLPVGGLGAGHRRRGCDAEQCACPLELLGPVTVGEEAGLTDAVEASRQGVQQEAADEFLGVEGQRPLPSAVAVVAPAEGDLAAVNRDDAVVGDGDTVGVAAEVVEDLLGATEGPLGVDHSFGLAQLGQEALEGDGVAQHLEGAMQLQLAPAKEPVEPVEAPAGGAAQPSRASHYMVILLSERSMTRRRRDSDGLTRRMCAAR